MNEQYFMWLRSKFFFLLLIAYFSQLLVTGCTEKIKPSVASTGVGQDVPAQESWNSRITFTDSGKVTAVVFAGHIAVYANSRTTSLDDGIQVDFFDQHEQHTSTLTAQRGLVNDVTHDLEAYGDVVVVSDSGATLKTQELFWNDARQLIHTPAYVEIISPTEQIQGHGLESDQSLKNYRIFRVTGQAKNE
jgi:LPS export ABC transporter protein LptC